jgi:flavin reductase (DIM6/NTAB) family NADH-FMN oxidoreductase RutF
MDLKKKQKALRMISNGMYVMTSRAGDKYGGATITWLTQASFKPPLIMAAVRPDSSVFECLTQSGSVAVHLLGEGQQEIARKFISTTEVHDGKINGEPFIEGKNSSPILLSAPAYVECKVLKVVDGDGDHSIVVMEVVEAEVRQEVRPLLVSDSPWKYGG